MHAREMQWKSVLILGFQRRNGNDLERARAVVAPEARLVIHDPIGSQLIHQVHRLVALSALGLDHRERHHDGLNRTICPDFELLSVHISASLDPFMPSLPFFHFKLSRIMICVHGASKRQQVHIQRVASHPKRRFGCW